MAARPPRNDGWLPYVIVGGSALLAIIIAAVGTLSLVSLGRDTPPEVAGEALQQTTIITAPTQIPEPTATSITVPLQQPTPVASPVTEVTTPAGPSQPDDPARPVARTASIVTYTVEAGDTLVQLSARFGVSTQTIMAANGLSSPEALQVGQELKIPTMDGLVYEVEAGDTVAAIARTYGVTAGEIVDANELGAEAIIHVGQMLVIPGAKAPLAEATASPTPLPASPTAEPDVTATPAAPTPTPEPEPTAPPQPTATPAPAEPGSGAFEWPALGGVIQEYSAERPGIDLSGGEGSPVLASAAGRVANVRQDDSGFGWQILLEHADGFSTFYAHLSAIEVQVGDQVEQLQVIGRIGQTGDVSGPRLHFQIRLNGSPENPRNYLP